ncbi:MAG: DUF6049 family protein [Acidimicrobiales bacterium]
MLKTSMVAMAAFASPGATGTMSVPAHHEAPARQVLAATATEAGYRKSSKASVPHGAQPTIELISQAPWVKPGEPFSIRLATTGLTGSRTHQALFLTVYQHLLSQSAFEQSLSGSVTSGILSEPSPIPLDSLPTSAEGGASLVLPVLAAGRPPGATGTPAINLRCVPGECHGIYPVRIAVVDTASSRTLASLTTYLVYTNPPSNTQRLRFAWVAPFGSPASTLVGATGATVPPAATVTGLQGLLAGIEAYPSVPLTVVPEPALLADLAASPHTRYRSMATALAYISALPYHQVLAAPYVPVDAASLATTGLGAEIARQVHRGEHVLSTLGIHSPETTWIASAALGYRALGDLTALGERRLVLPPSAVEGPAGKLTPSQPFTLTSSSSGSSSASTAVLADPEITSLLSSEGRGAARRDGTGGAPSPALDAQRVLADLALIYFEEPNLTRPRGIVAVPPSGSPIDPALVKDVLAGLATSPVIEPVTLATLFATVPAEVSGAPLVHQLAPAPAPSIPARAIRQARSREEAFASASGSTAPVQSLDDLILEDECDELTVPEQLDGLARFAAALRAQLSLLSLTSDRTILVTASTARIPVTILSRSPYPVTGVLRVSSDKLLFPHGNTRRVTIDRRTNAVYMTVQARATGDFPINVSLSSPRGNLVLLSGRLTVQSTATSAVAIALSLGAVAVLAIWWARTSLWRRRRTALHGRAARHRASHGHRR